MQNTQQHFTICVSYTEVAQYYALYLKHYSVAYNAARNVRAQHTCCAQCTARNSNKKCAARAQRSTACAQAHSAAHNATQQAQNTMQRTYAHLQKLRLFARAHCAVMFAALRASNASAQFLHNACAVLQVTYTQAGIEE